jgi:hypothetical protein
VQLFSVYSSLYSGPNRSYNQGKEAGKYYACSQNYAHCPYQCFKSICGRRSRSRWELRTYVGVEEGESLQERHSHMGPSSTQEYSSFAVVEESEVFYPWKVLPLGDPVEPDSGGRCEDDQMGPVHWGPNREGRRSFRRTSSPGLIEIVIGWGRIWSACSLRSSLRRLR